MTRMGQPGETSDRVRVLIAERRALYAAALRTMLEAEPDMRVVATVAPDAGIAETAAHTGADVALVDIEHSNLEPATLSCPLYRMAPRCRLIVLTDHALPEVTARSWAAHAAGVISKHSPAPLLVDAVRRVSAGEQVIDPRTAERAVHGNSTLTVREVDLLRHAAHGHSVKELAARMSLSHGTVRNYLSRINAKLGARNRIEAIRIGRDSGWI